MRTLGPENAYIDTYEWKCNDESKFYVWSTVCRQQVTKSFSWKGRKYAKS